MPQYVVFAVDDDEDAWERADEETRNKTCLLYTSDAADE